jgi:hypothetical protein
MVSRLCYQLTNAEPSVQVCAEAQARGLPDYQNCSQYAPSKPDSSSKSIAYVCRVFPAQIE